MNLKWKVIFFLDSQSHNGHVNLILRVNLKNKENFCNLPVVVVVMDGWVLITVVVGPPGSSQLNVGSKLQYVSEARTKPGHCCCTPGNTRHHSHYILNHKEQ